MKNPEKNQKSILTKKVRRLSSGSSRTSKCRNTFSEDPAKTVC